MQKRSLGWKLELQQHTKQTFPHTLTVSNEALTNITISRFS